MPAVLALRIPIAKLVRPAGVAINPATAEVFTVDSVRDSLFIFGMPELVRRPGDRTTATGGR